MTLYQRRDLALTLEAFLGLHPRQAERFRDIILSLFWSPAHELCLRGVYQVGYLNSLGPRERSRLLQKLSASVGIRMNTLNGLTLLVKRHREVDPAVIELATSDRIRRTAQRIQRTDPDKDARTCAYHLLKAIREYQRGRG